MDYFGHKCPVCDKYFHIGDDIVVCPECGTPSHRECYNETGRCANSDKHADGYDFSNDKTENPNNTEDFTICKKCGTQNDKNSFFCVKCNSPLQETPPVQNTPYGSQQPNGQPFTNMGPNVIFIDPLAGVKPETDFGDGVTAGECAKYVKQNTQYFTSVFNNIKNFSKSRFNFCGLIFGGGYLLYRKMYKIGSLITIIQAAIMVFSIYLDNYIMTSGGFEKIRQAAEASDFNAIALHYSQLSAYNTAMILIYGALSILSLVIYITVGCCANRMYYKHCKKQVAKIKANSQNITDRDNELSKKGGVNVPLALSLLVSDIILSYLPYMFI